MKWQNNWGKTIRFFTFIQPQSHHSCLVPAAMSSASFATLTAKTRPTATDAHETACSKAANYYLMRRTETR